MKTVAIDLDGTLARYDGWKGIEHIGEPLLGARKLCQAIRDAGYRICVFTTRFNTEGTRDITRAKQVVVDWLTLHQIPYDDLWDQVGKPMAVAYIDDRALKVTPNPWYTDTVRRAILTEIGVLGA